MQGMLIHEHMSAQGMTTVTETKNDENIPRYALSREGLR